MVVSLIVKTPFEPGGFFVFILKFILTLENLKNMTAYQKLQKIQEKYKTQVRYSVGFNTEISAPALEIIKELKGDLNPEDIIPELPTSLAITVFKTSPKPEENKILAHFYQDSITYMEAFDKKEFENFVDVVLEPIKL